MAAKRSSEKPVHPIKNIRLKMGFSQAEMGTILDLTGAVIAQIENNFSSLPSKAKNALIEHLGLSLEQFDQELADYQRDYKAFLLGKHTL